VVVDQLEIHGRVDDAGDGDHPFNTPKWTWRLPRSRPLVVRDQTTCKGLQPPLVTRTGAISTTSVRTAV